MTASGIAPRAARRPDDVSPPRLGFLGVGWIGRHRMEAIAASALATVAGIADPTPESVAAARASAPDAELADSLDGLLALDLDGLVIATPSALHSEQTIRALEQGVPVFCQKPLARTADEARRVVDAARAADRLLGVDFSYRYVRGVPLMRELIGSGALGRIFAADLVFHNAYGPDKPWFYDRAHSGGGCVMDLGVHLVDLGLWLLGDVQVERVTSRLFHQGRALLAGATEVEDYAEARLDLSSDAAVRLACSWRLHAGCDAMIEASFYGTEGGVRLRNVGGSFYDFVIERFTGTAREALVEPPDAWGGRAAVAWAEQLGSDASFDPEIERAVDVAAALDAIYRCASS